MLQDKFCEAYLFLLQHHKEFPNVWEHPQDLVIMNSKLTKWMMEKFSFEKLQLQVPSWNVLLPVMTGDVINRKCCMHSMFGCYFVEVLADMDGPRKYHWEVETGSKDKIVSQWNLNHELCEAKLYWLHHEQKTMEKYLHDLFTN